MQANFSLRRFRPEDLDEVIHINRVCLPENYSESFFMDLYERFPETFIVAEGDGKIIGYVMCRIESNVSNITLRPLSLTKKGHIISIAVLPAYRRRGIGQALIKEALRAMIQYYKAKSCYLEVRVTNTSAVNLYKKMGFEIERVIRGYYSDGEDAYIMSENLSDKEKIQSLF
ncbi:MAG: ribosomal protein S18-alanine N-acetyltransferase [Nitrososphaerota archaeon]|nr:ribosomal protein S18-alanine N-acetyltransferase [Candidatus Bathyarchaeota archaeon]MDW8048148.1 ribosomal protein S18-alanine N-acetyltransferase [Nitrososphaerota archaeon]